MPFVLCLARSKHHCLPSAKQAVSSFFLLTSLLPFRSIPLGSMMANHINIGRTPIVYGRAFGQQLDFGHNQTSVSSLFDHGTITSLRLLSRTKSHHQERRSQQLCRNFRPIKSVQRDVIWFETYLILACKDVGGLLVDLVEHTCKFMLD